MSGRGILRAIGAAAVVMTGTACTHRVDFEDPPPLAFGAKLPIDASFAMSDAARTATWTGRSWGSGIANSWLVPIGEIVNQYARIELPAAVRSFEESPDGAAPSGSARHVIRVESIDFRMQDQAAHATIAIKVVAPGGAPLFEKSYTEDGPSGYGRVFAGGAFAQKSAIRQSTHVVLETMFRKFVEDLRVAAAGPTP
jgi:hypothetical protein